MFVLNSPPADNNMGNNMRKRVPDFDFRDDVEAQMSDYDVLRWLCMANPSNPKTVTDVTIFQGASREDGGWLLSHIPREQDAHMLTCEDFNSLPLDLVCMPVLDTLCCSGNCLGNAAFPSWLGDLPCLASLDLSRTRLCTLPPTLGNLRMLQHFDCQHNRLTAVPGEIGCLTALQTLDLTGNKLRQLHDNIGLCTALRHLRLDGNALEAVPDTLRGLTNLWCLACGGNRLSTLPRCLSSMTGLLCLELQDNRFEQVPWVVCQMTRLTSLYLSNNQLLAVPEDMGNMHNLLDLNLKNNNLTVLPESVGVLAHHYMLRNLAVEGNSQLKFLPRTGSDYCCVSWHMQCVIPDDEQIKGPPSLYSLSLHAAVLFHGHRLPVSPCTIAQPGDLTRAGDGIRRGVWAVSTADCVAEPLEEG